MLAAGAAVWVAGGIGAFIVANYGADWLVSLLPPLAIDAAGVGGAVAALGALLLVVGAVHLVTVIGLRRGARWAAVGGALLATTLAAVLVALLAAAVTTLASGTPSPALVAIGGLVAAAASAIYGWCAAALVRALGAPADAGSVD